MPAPMKGRADPMEGAVHKPDDDGCRCAGCRSEGDSEEQTSKKQPLTADG